MKLIQYSVAKQETGNASGKAKKDAFDIAERMGFKPSYRPSNTQLFRVVQQILSFPRFHGKDVIFYQYPAVNNMLFKGFKKFVSKKSIKIALVHDLISIQGLYDFQINQDIDSLRFFDCIIVHNQKMNDFVRGIGYRGNVVNLELFDYLHDVDHSIQCQSFSNSIAFAGNLGKAKFLKQLDSIKCNWILYGVSGETDFSNISNVSYKGLLPSDEIPYLMEGDYGLVWDGDSIDTCNGPNGEYLKFNNPHKLSCCIAAGKPVVTWRQAAIADFINKYKIGITVDSLEELNDIDMRDGYAEMKENVMILKKDIAKGRFLERAIHKALELRCQ